MLSAVAPLVVHLPLVHATDRPPRNQPKPSPLPNGEPAPPTPSPPAREAPAGFQRHLPHYEGSGKPLHITFSTKGRQFLPEHVRHLVLDHVRHDHGTKMELICAVVMPDHVHMVYQPWSDSDGNQYTKTEIVGAIKGSSAHSINKTLGRKGPLWQDESFDRVLRVHESVRQKAEYIIDNAVKEGLCQEPDEYQFLWRAWVEGEEDSCDS